MEQPLASSATPPKYQKLNMVNLFNVPLQLNLAKIINIVATRCQILRLKYTKFDFGWGSAPDPAGGAYNAPPDPLAGFKGAYF